MGYIVKVKPSHGPVEYSHVILWPKRLMVRVLENRAHLVWLHVQSH